MSYARRGSIRVQGVAQRGKHVRPLSHEFTLHHTGHPQDRIHLESRHDPLQAFCHVSMRHRGHRVPSEHRRSLQDHLRRDQSQPAEPSGRDDALGSHGPRLSARLAQLLGELCPSQVQHQPGGSFRAGPNKRAEATQCQNLLARESHQSGAHVHICVRFHAQVGRGTVQFV